jgi:hypothetical protein
MFRAIVPTLFGPTIATVPRLSMLFHNDCLYIVQYLVSVGHEVRGRCVRRCVVSAFTGPTLTTLVACHQPYLPTEGNDDDGGPYSCVSEDGERGFA